jgi:hypothetical protein
VTPSKRRALPKMRNEAVADAGRIIRVAVEFGLEGSLLEHGSHGDDETRPGGNARRINLRMRSRDAVGEAVRKRA